jgi:putative hydrolase of the HAD superfamily
MYKAIIFDFDDTLTDRGELYRRYCYYIIDKYFNLPDDADKEEMIREMCEWDNRGYSDRIAVNNRIIERWNLSVTAEQLQDELFHEGAKFTVLEENVIETLEYLKGKYKLGMVTNGSPVFQGNKIASSGLAKYFDDIIISGNVGIHKPDKEIFLLSCAHLGVLLQEAVYVGDQMYNDIGGAENAGMTAVLYTKHVNALYKNTISNLLELKQLF